MRTFLLFSGVCAAIALAPIATRAQDSSPPARAGIEEVAPHWAPGDRWTVETVSRVLHVRGEVSPTRTTAPLRWDFQVMGLEGLGPATCYRVEVRHAEQRDSAPAAVLWLDRDSRVLRQITTRVPVAGGMREMTMRYDFEQPTPILGPLSGIPVDTPVFLTGAKGLHTFQYTTHVGPAEGKTLGDVGFAHAIEQQDSEVPSADVGRLMSASFAKSLVDDPFAKAIAAEPAREIQLESAGRQVRQLWQANRPWPIYCDNGYTVARLVADEPSHPSRDEEQQP